MNRYPMCAVLISMVLAVSASAGQFQSDVITTSGGDLTITFIGHGSLLFTYQGKTIHVDPYSKLADYATHPKADVILITHEHRDHLDPDALAKVRKDGTMVIVNGASSQQVSGSTVMKNGESKTVDGIKIGAVPAYNLVHKRDNGQPFHPKGSGNGYVITFGDKRVYIAGDTENVPEMKNLGTIDIAFLPMNLPYTMTPEMTADAAGMVKPAILYPYHFGDTDTAKLNALLKDRKDIEIRIRKMQ